MWLKGLSFSQTTFSVMLWFKSSEQGLGTANRFAANFLPGEEDLTCFFLCHYDHYHRIFKLS